MKRLVIAAAVAATLAGCGSTGKGQKEFDASKSLASAGNYAEAIAYLNQAIAKEPNNKQYAAQLSALKKQAADDLSRQAKAVLDSAEVNISQIEDAEGVIAQALTMAPERSDFSVMQTELATKKTELLENVKFEYDKAVAAIDKNDWVAANLALQKVQKQYPNYERSVPLSNRVKSEGVRDYLIQAKQAFDDFDFNQATLLARKAQMLDRSNAMAKQMAARASENNNPRFFAAKAAEAFTAQQWQDVIFACDKLKEMGSSEGDCANWMTMAVENQANEMLDEGSRLLGEGYIARAANVVVDVEKMLNGASTPKALRLRSAVLERAQELAEEYTDMRNFGVAWHMYQLMSKIDPMIEGLFAAQRSVEDKITERVTKSIAVFDFKSPSYDEDAGVLIAQQLIANLFNNARNDTNILERENLKNILEEMKLGQIGVVSENTAKEMGRLYGIDIAIMGSVLLYKVDESFTESAETVRYKVGEEIRDNIDFLNWKALNPNPTKSDLAKAPQPKIMVPVTAEKEYTVQRAKKVGFIEISFRIVNVSTGENTRVETIQERLVEEDSGNEGVKDANIKFDPLEVLTDTEMLQQMAAKVVEKLSLKVLQPLRNRELEYFEEAEEVLVKRQEQLPALEKFVDAMFDERIKGVVNSPISSKVEEYSAQIIENYQFRD